MSTTAAGTRSWPKERRSQTGPYSNDGTTIGPAGSERRPPRCPLTKGPKSPKVADDVQPSATAGNYRSATRHRLQEDQAERLVLRRRDEHIGYVQDLRQLLMEQPAAEEDVGEPEASGCRCTDAPLPIRRERLHRPGD